MCKQIKETMPNLCDVTNKLVPNFSNHRSGSIKANFKGDWQYILRYHFSLTFHLINDNKDVLTFKIRSSPSWV